MVNVVIVDDELPAIRLAESVLRSMEEVSVTASYTDVEDVLQNMETMIADLILLDIKMPGMHGLELAGRITERRPEIAVVFVTAYESYAIDAFEAEALDYILKPLTETRIRKTLERFLRRREIGNIEKPKQVKIRSFGRFCMENEKGEVLRFRTVKTEELMAFLLQNGSNAVPKERIIEELWYDRDTEKAQSILYTTLYQLRKDLEKFGLENIVESTRKEGGICYLKWTAEDWDCARFLQIYQTFISGSFDVGILKQMPELFLNGYLAAHDYPWAAAKAIEYEAAYFEMQKYLIDDELEQGHLVNALQYLNQLCQLFSDREELYERMIRILILQNGIDSAMEYYHNIRIKLKKEEGLDLLIDIKKIESQIYPRKQE